MAIVLDGNLGITTPAETVQGALTTTGNTILGDASTDTLNVGNGGLVKDASGNVGIGTASPTKLLSVGKTQNAETSILVQNSSTGTAGKAIIRFGNSNGENVGSVGALSSGFTPSGELEADGFYVDSARQSLNLSSSNNGIIKFFGAGTERMRIDSSGNLLVGTTSAAANERFNLVGNLNSYLARNNNSNASPAGYYIHYSGASPNGTVNEFLRLDDSTANRVSIRSNGGIANYSANNVNLSDAREKNNIELAGSYLDKVCAIPVKTFNYIDQNRDEDDGLTLGVIAQDVQTVAPELVMESNWADNDSPEKMRLSIYQTDLQYALMKSIQELKAIVDAQAVRIAALES